MKRLTGKWRLLLIRSKTGSRSHFLTTIDTIVTPKIELAIRSINASSERHATSVMASSERGEHIGITAPFENVSEKENTLDMLNTNVETRNKISDDLK